MKIFNKFYVKFLVVFFLTATVISPLRGWSSNNAIIKKPLKDVIVAAKAFNKVDCKKYLGRNVLSKGYQPVQIIIKNNSSKNLIFSLDNVSLPCARTEEVAARVHTSTAGRATAYGAGSLFLWPLAIPAIVDGVKSAEANESLDSDYHAKTAKSQLLVPSSKLNGLIFVPVESYRNTFTVTLIDQDTRELHKVVVSVW